MKAGLLDGARLIRLKEPTSVAQHLSRSPIVLPIRNGVQRKPLEGQQPWRSVKGKIFTFNADLSNTVTQARGKSRAVDHQETQPGPTLIESP
jgi:hypothetical protein